MRLSQFIENRPIFTRSEADLKLYENVVRALCMVAEVLCQVRDSRIRGGGRSWRGKGEGSE